MGFFFVFFFNYKKERNSMGKKKKSSLPLIIEQFFKVTLCAKGWSKSVRDSKGVLILFIWSRSVCIKKKNSLMKFRAH